MGAKAKAEGGSSVAIGGAFNTFAGWEYTAATGTQGVAVGAGAKASGDYGTAIGPVARATAIATTALGDFALASGEAATAMGATPYARGVFGSRTGERRVGHEWARTWRCRWWLNVYKKK